MIPDVENLVFTETSSLTARRCECGSSEFEDTGRRIYCVRCGLVDEDRVEINRRIFHTDGTYYL